MSHAVVATTEPIALGRFQSLDGLRGLAALAIALFHLNFGWHGEGSQFLSNTYLFVDFFFVLSGFVVTHAYRRRVGTGREFLSFVLLRFGRLWPLAAFTLSVLVALEIARTIGGTTMGSETAFTGSTEPVAILTNLLLVHALHIHDQLTWNGPSWSISVEFYTYLLFGALLLLTSRVVTAAVVVGLTAAALVVAWSTTGMDVTYDYGIFRCLAGFMTGVVVYFTVIPRLALVSVRPYGPATLAEIAVATLALLFVALADRGPISIAAPVVFGLVVATFSFGAGALSRLLRSGPLQLLGRISYSIYLTHIIVVMLAGAIAGPAGRLLGAEFERTTTDTNGVSTRTITFFNIWVTDLAVVGYLVAVILVSILTYRYIEVPGMRLFSRWAKAATPQPRAQLKPAEHLPTDAP